MDDTSIAVPNKTLLRVDEVARIFRVDISTVYGYVKTGKLPCARRIGKPIRIRRSDVLDIMNSGEEP